MSSKKRLLHLLIAGLFILLAISSTPIVHGATWINLPPYNTLWPLWSPPLSPTNSLSGLPTPIVSNLKPSTVLPVQPGLTWDPNLDHPWLLYNTPLGMAYYDPVYGVNNWPPDYLKDPITGLPAPINLKPVKSWSTLAPTSTAWLSDALPVANNAFVNAYPAYAVAYEILQKGTLSEYPILAALTNPPPPLQSLLNSSLLLGLGPLVP